jgi:hypothetical protein
MGRWRGILERDLDHDAVLGRDPGHLDGGEAPGQRLLRHRLDPGPGYWLAVGQRRPGGAPQPEPFAVVVPRWQGAARMRLDDRGCLRPRWSRIAVLGASHHPWRAILRRVAGIGRQRAGVIRAIGRLAAAAAPAGAFRSLSRKFPEPPPTAGRAGPVRVAVGVEGDPAVVVGGGPQLF